MLPKDDDFEFYPLEWAQASAQAHNQTLRQLAAFKLRASNEQDTIAKLNKQLEEFIEAKNETENVGSIRATIPDLLCVTLVWRSILASFLNIC